MACFLHRSFIQIPFGAKETEAEILTIRFVAAEGGEVTGMLDPYLDPDCQCRAFTRFRGRQRGDVIEGTYTTRTARSEDPDRGAWRVRRVKG